MSKVVGDLTIGGSTTVGIVAVINEYAIVFSLGLTALGIAIGLIFHLLALKDRRKQMTSDDKIKELEEKLKASIKSNIK